MFRHGVDIVLLATIVNLLVVVYLAWLLRRQFQREAEKSAS